MSACMIVLIDPKNPEKLAEYRSKAGPQIAAIGGEPIAGGPVLERLAGASDAKACAVFRFPDIDTIKNWYESPDYQALLPLRNEAGEFTFLVVEAD